MPAAWVAGDEVYGADPGLRRDLHDRQIGYVLAVAKDHRVMTGAGTFRADALAARLPRAAWQRLSAGPGAKGYRYYDWAWVARTSCAGPGGDDVTSTGPGHATTSDNPWKIREDHDLRLEY